MSVAKFKGRLRTFQFEINELSIAHGNPVNGHAFDMAIIRLHSSWEQFVREYLLQKAAQSQFPSGIATRSRKNACLSRYRLLKPKMNREPNWGVPTEVIEFSRAMALPDHSSILAVMGVTPWLLDDLRHFRNYLAHRSEEAAIKFLNKASPSVKDLRSHAIETVDPVVGTKRFHKWVEEMFLISGLLP